MRVALSENIEEYLETLYKLSQRKKLISTSSISRELGIANASATQMLQRLAKMGFVDYSPYKGVKLTMKGYMIAEKIIRKHRLLERFLHDMLKLKQEKIHPQACEMEHALSDDAERALCQLLKQPSHCPDKNPIPPCNLKFETCDECLKRKDDDVEEIGLRDQNLLSLPQLKEMGKGRISFIRGDYKFLKDVMNMGITIGTLIKVLKKIPRIGSVEIEVNGSRIVLEKNIAENIFINAKNH
ncbi:MAG TPA: metal-dependent transcriptional regulator [Methanothermobacter sp.]|nr:iron dependent transcriptional regulator [Methanothermobacter sp. MT-2]HHW05276.1 metal-dependent transcriptional regulator [Methanothermobacter sp.]HOK72887.1 metal-dependent transcriptional regulator [Methanothermobacter sp.]HOL69027.1 metal-dependent transcriptional regulator [Methanothermobacter sp.]HPQ04836.1 metal-dependent transcriptional regulator [Methanothermobacter sp.]